MRYKFMLGNAAYKVVRASDAFAPQVYRSVSLMLVLTMPDGTPLRDQTVSINGVDTATGSDGQISLTGDMGLTEKLHIVYDVIYTADIEVTYTAAAVYNVALEQHVAAGSVSVSEWEIYSTSSYKKAAYTLVVPPAVTVVKITGSRKSSSYKAGSLYVGTNGEAIQQGDVVIQYGGTSSAPFEKYVGVTPDKTYTIYGRNVKDAVIEWSDEINEHAVDVTI